MSSVVLLLVCPTACRIFAKLNVAFFARKYPAVQDAFLKSLLEVSVRYHRTLAGEKVSAVTYDTWLVKRSVLYYKAYWLVNRSVWYHKTHCLVNRPCFLGCAGLGHLKERAKITV